jgi:hypothetical protein
MTTDTRYNGWTNYATWRVALEIFDCLDIRWMYPTEVADDDAYGLGQLLEEYADSVVTQDGSLEGLAVDYARTFLKDVSWYEIAKHMLDDIKAEDKA